MNTNPTIDSDSEVLTAARTLLRHCRTASLATVGADARAHAANVQFVADDQLNLYFTSSADSQHARDVAASGHVALTVYDHRDQDPRTLRGLQIRGPCAVVPQGADRQHAQDLYLWRFDYLTRDPCLLELLRTQPMFVVRPRWVRRIDNSRGFGYCAEWSLPAV